MASREEHWQQLQTSLTALVKELAINLDEKDTKLLQDFIANREYGVALEWLHSLFSERSLPLSFEHCREIERLAASMGIKLEG